MLSRVGVRTDAVYFLRPASLSWKVTQIKTGAQRPRLAGRCSVWPDCLVSCPLFICPEFKQIDLQVIAIPAEMALGHSFLFGSQLSDNIPAQP
jgi:hypothetical protein